MGASRRLGTQHEVLVVLMDGDFLDPIEIAHHIDLFEIEAGGEALIEVLGSLRRTSDEREKRAKQVITTASSLS